MEISKRESNMLAEVFTEVQARFVDFTDLAHGWEHVYRVYHLSLRIAEQEHADSFIVGMAALLHDIGRTLQEPKKPHAERSAILAAEILAQFNLSNGTQQAILHAILAHNYRRGIAPATLEARVLYDADRLDSMVASGLIRWAMTLKNKNGLSGKHMIQTTRSRYSKHQMISAICSTVSIRSFWFCLRQ